MRSIEGLRIRETEMVDVGQVGRNEMADMEQYLGPSTLAKLKGLDDDLEAEMDGAAIDEFRQLRWPVLDDEPEVGITLPNRVAPAAEAGAHLWS